MELLSVREVAERLKVSVRQIWKLASSARLPRAVRIGRSVRWRADDIDRWIQQDCPSRDRFEAERKVRAGR